jgi:hypothetical protein
MSGLGNCDPGQNYTEDPDGRCALDGSYCTYRFLCGYTFEYCPKGFYCDESFDNSTNKTEARKELSQREENTTDIKECMPSYYCSLGTSQPYLCMMGVIGCPTTEMWAISTMPVFWSLLLLVILCLLIFRAFARHQVSKREEKYQRYGLNDMMSFAGGFAGGVPDFMSAPPRLSMRAPKADDTRSDYVNDQSHVSRALGRVAAQSQRFQRSLAPGDEYGNMGTMDTFAEEDEEEDEEGSAPRAPYPPPPPPPPLSHFATTAEPVPAPGEHTDDFTPTLDINIRTYVPA